MISLLSVLFSNIPSLVWVETEQFTLLISGEGLVVVNPAGNFILENGQERVIFVLHHSSPDSLEC